MPISRLRSFLQRPTAQSAGWLLLDRAVRLGGGLLVSLLVARLLGPADFGLFSYALTIALFATTMAALGGDGILVRELVHTRDTPAATLGSAAALRLGAGFLGLGVAGFAAALLRPADSSLLGLTLILGLAAPLGASQVIDLWFQARQQPRNAVLARIGAFSIAAAWRIGLVLHDAPLGAFAWATSGEALLGAIAALVVYRHAGGQLSTWRISAVQVRLLLRDGLPLLVASLLVTLYLRVDQLMIGWLLGDAPLGLYSAAVRLAEPWVLLPTTLLSAALPGLVALREGDPAAFEQRISRLYAAITAYGYIIGLLATLLAGTLAPLLLGSAFAEAVPSVIILTWAGLFAALGSARGVYLVAMGWTNLHTPTVALGALANLLLNLWLIPQYGLAGAAFASLIAYWFAAHGACFLFPQLRPTGAALSRALLRPKFW
jgi:O-antigen/teichoic acid export membrane protein